MDVCVIGAGPTGLVAAHELSRLGVSRICVVDREPAAGGMPRHCPHPVFGIVDQRRVLRGPSYAKRLTEMARRSKGVEIITETTLVASSGFPEIALTGPEGTFRVCTRALLYATGCRETPRGARLIAGNRPLGIFTTESLQRLAVGKPLLGGRAVIVGAETVSFSTLRTLRAFGAEVVSMVTEHPRHQTYGVIRALAGGLSGVRVLTGTRVVSIAGAQRVESVELEGIETGQRRVIDCDWVVFTGEFVPESEHPSTAGVDMDLGTRGPRVDSQFRCSKDGIFAAGNLIHAAEMAHVCVGDAKRVARAIHQFLQSPSPGERRRLSITVSSPLAWVCPNVWVPIQSASCRYFLLRSHTCLGQGRVMISQENRALWEARLDCFVPNRSLKLSSGWVTSVREDGGPVQIDWRS